MAEMAAAESSKNRSVSHCRKGVLLSAIRYKRTEPMLACITIGVGIWSWAIYPAEVSLPLQYALGAVWWLYIGYFTVHGAKALVARTRLALAR